MANRVRMPHELFVLGLMICALTPDGGAQKSVPIPDFTKGDEIPEGASHDWNLGATGCRGWMHSDRLVTTDARQIRITSVDAGSPAAGVLQVGDVLLGIGSETFESDPRTELGRALTRAEADAGGGTLSLRRWRQGRTDTVIVKLPVLGAYAATAPFACAKSQRIAERGFAVLADRIRSGVRAQDPIVRSLNALALLASGDPTFWPILKSEATWASNFSAEGFQTWSYGYTLIFLSEYLLATGDDSVRPGLRRLTLEAANGQSLVGSWGHRFARTDARAGRLMGYGMMNSPGVPLTLGIELAREAGIRHPAVDRAIDRSVRLLEFYSGKGAIPYGDHAPWMENHEDNGKCGMAAVLFSALGRPLATEFFSRMSLAAHGSDRDTGHTGNFFNILWAIPGIAPSGPNATGAWMDEFGSWYFDLARRWDGTFAHQGPPEPSHDSYRGWDCTGVYVLAYAAPRKKVALTGRRPPPIQPIDPPTAQRLIDDGRGWTNKDRTSAYDRYDVAQLVARLSSWSPIVRDRAAQALARKTPTISVAPLIALLGSSDLTTRLGGCEALAKFQRKAAPAVPQLTKLLEHEDLWLRIRAAEALAAIGPSAFSALPRLLTMLAKDPQAEDPRGMEQRYLSFAVFGTLLKRSLDGVDRDLLRAAVKASLTNQDGRARGAVGNVFRQLTFEEVRPLLPAIKDAIIDPAPSGIMFASEVRLRGLELLAAHRIREGLELCFHVMEVDDWNARERTTKCLRVLESYGAAAKPMLPRLRELQSTLSSRKDAKSFEPLSTPIRELIERLEKAGDAEPLRSLDETP